MPILAAATFNPPPWWPQLTDSQRHTIIARLRKCGHDVTAWPETIAGG